MQETAVFITKSTEGITGDTFRIDRTTFATGRTLFTAQISDERGESMAVVLTREQLIALRQAIIGEALGD